MKDSAKSVLDKSLAYAIRRGDISLNKLPLKKRKKISAIVKGPTSTEELKKASGLKYKISRRKIVHVSKNENVKTFNGFIGGDRADDLPSEIEKNKYKKMEKRFVTSFGKFSKLNEDNLQNINPQRISRENKFKGFIEYSPDIEKSLEEHSFRKIEGVDEGDFIIFDIMNKDYTFTNESPDNIRPYDERGFDHVMNNL